MAQDTPAVSAAIAIEEPQRVDRAPESPQPRALNPLGKVTATPHTHVRKRQARPPAKIYAIVLLGRGARKGTARGPPVSQKIVDLGNDVVFPAMRTPRFFPNNPPAKLTTFPLALSERNPAKLSSTRTAGAPLSPPPTQASSALRMTSDTYEPPWSFESTVATDYTLHQLAPYIGRMKTSIARSLVLGYSAKGDLVVDPFCGSGVVPLEAAAAGRQVVAGDWNPYAVLLTRAKLFAPRDLNQAKRRLDRAWKASRTKVEEQDVDSIPSWVHPFFHPETLQNALAFRDACLELDEPFLLACLLGILHHERPGFLSNPSSHLVPYLRDKKYPRETCPEMYEARDVHQRLVAKVARTYRRPLGQPLLKRRIFECDARAFPRVRRIKAVITSPPYMNELEYVRDNRLRIWFLLGTLPSGLDLVHRNRTAAFNSLVGTVCARLAGNIVEGGVIVLVVGEATRGHGDPAPTALIAENLFTDHKRLREFELEKRIHDVIPDIRRSRRECQGTKSETILVFRKVER